MRAGGFRYQPRPLAPKDSSMSSHHSGLLVVLIVSGSGLGCGIKPTDPREPNSCISWAGERICSCAREQRFAVEGDTVKEKATGLTWQRRDSSVDSPIGSNGGRVTRAKAAEYCASLTVAGGGWRLPTADEARVLVDDEDDRYRCFSPCAFDGACGNYWTSTAATSTTGHSLRVSQYFGSTEPEDDAAELDVRCVR